MTEDTERVVHLGSVAVDSGHLMIADPCYVLKGQEWDDACDAIVAPRQTHGVQLPHMATPFGKLIFESGLGDGIYDVEAVIGDVPGWGERIKQVTITLIDESVYDADEEDEDGDGD